MARYLQQHSEILQLPMAVFPIDTVGHSAIASKGNRWALTTIFIHASYVFAIAMKAKSAENVVQVYFLVL